jgi:cystine transport system substrate-binding protein
VRGLSPGSRGRAAALLLAAGLVLSAPAASGADPSASAAKLRNRGSALDTKAHRALLDLYSLETQLAGARARLGSVQGEASRVRAQRALVRRQVAIAQRALTVSQAQLGVRLRTLYEEGQPDPIAVILGASSLDEALTSLDELHRAARQSEAVIAQTTATRRTLDRLSATLSARSARLDAIQRQVAASAADLASRRADRAGLLVSLRTQQRLNQRTIAALQATALAAEVKTQTLTARAAATPRIAVTADAPPAVTSSAQPAPAPAPSGGRTLTVSSTGYSLPGTTATGLPVGWGIVAVDPGVIPLGTHMTVPGYGEAVAADTGSAVRGATIDLWFPSLAQARAWGRRTVTITLH